MLISLQVFSVIFGLLLAWRCSHRDVLWLSFFLLISSTLYFLPSLAPYFDGVPTNTIAMMHGLSNNIPFSMKLGARLAVLFVIFICWQRMDKGLRIKPLAWLLLFFLPISFLWQQGGRLPYEQVQDLSALMPMFFLCFYGANAWVSPKSAMANEMDRYSILLKALWLLLLLSVFIAYWEIALGLTWANFETTQGIVMRATSLMYSPSVYGLWCALLAFIFAFCLHSKGLEHLKNWLSSGIALAALGLFFTSSRSMVYMLVALFLGTALLLPKGSSRRWQPLLVLMGACLMTIIIAGICWRLNPSLISQRFWLLATRLFETPYQLLTLIGTKANANTIQSAAANTLIAIKDRFTGAEPDSGWVTMFRDGGFLGLFTLAIFGFSLLYFALMTVFKARTVTSVYALASVCFFLMLGVVARYQFYPMWLYMGLLLAPCLTFFRQKLGSKVWL